MVIIEDVNQKLGKHVAKNEYWDREGVRIIRNRLPFGDYCLVPSVVIDTKNSIDEIYMDIINDNERFKNSCILAKECGSKFIILIETELAECLEDIANWQNPRIKEWYLVKNMQAKGKWMNKHIGKVPPADGKRLHKAMCTMQDRYGVEFMFCLPEESGKMVLELLTQ